MSEQQKAPIRDVQVDEILAQVEKKRASHGGKTPKASEAQLDAILKSMGLGERKRPRYSEPILLPSPVQEDARGSAAPAPGSAAQAAPAAPQAAAPQGGQVRPDAGQPAPEAQPQAAPEQEKEPEKEPTTVELPTAKSYAVIEDQKKEAERQRMLEQARLEVRRREQAEREKKLRAAQAQRVRKMEQAKREAAFTIHNSAQFAVQDALAAHMRQKASEAAAAAGEKPVEAPAPAAPAPAPARPNALFGEVDDQFRAFFSTTVATNREDVQRARRKKKGGGLFSRLRKKEPADTAELAALWGEEASESFTQELGNLGAIRDAIDQQKAQAPGAAAAAGEKPVEAPARPAPRRRRKRALSSILARPCPKRRAACAAPLATFMCSMTTSPARRRRNSPSTSPWASRCPRRTPPSRRAAAFRWRAKRWTNMSRSAMRPPWRKTWTTCAARACCAPWPAAFRPCCFSTLALRAAPGPCRPCFPRRKTRLCSCL